MKNTPSIHLAGWRNSRGLTQEQLAEAAGVSRVTVARIETQDQQPSVATIAALADALRVPWFYLYGYRSPPTNSPVAHVIAILVAALAPDDAEDFLIATMHEWVKRSSKSAVTFDQEKGWFDRGNKMKLWQLRDTIDVTLLTSRKVEALIENVLEHAAAPYLSSDDT